MAQSLSDNTSLAKRSFDIAVAATLLATLGPTLILVALAIKYLSGEPVFACEVRRGHRNEDLSIFHFRWAKPQVNREPASLTRNATWIGHLLRSSGLDGLLTLANVLRGEMSIIGPRPFSSIPSSVFAEKLARISQHRNYKPGLIGWSQVNGYGAESELFNVMRHRLELDLYYVENWSLYLDIKILLKAGYLLFMVPLA